MSPQVLSPQRNLPCHTAGSCTILEPPESASLILHFRLRSRKRKGGTLDVLTDWNCAVLNPVPDEVHDGKLKGRGSEDYGQNTQRAERSRPQEGRELH